MLKIGTRSGVITAIAIGVTQLGWPGSIAIASNECTRGTRVGKFVTDTYSTSICQESGGLVWRGYRRRNPREQITLPATRTGANSYAAQNGNFRYTVEGVIGGRLQVWQRGNLLLNERINAVSSSDIGSVRPPNNENSLASVPWESREACLRRTAEEFVTAVGNIAIASVGPIDAENGVRTLTMRNQANGRLAGCRVNTIDHTVLSVQISGTSSPVPPSSVNYRQQCVVRTAEEFVVATSTIQILGERSGPQGTRILTMQNRANGQRAECEVDVASGVVTAVRLLGMSSPTPSQSYQQQCIVRTAEEFVTATGNIRILGEGPLNPETGTRSVLLENRANGRRAECRVSTVTNTVLSVTIRP